MAVDNFLQDKNAVLYDGNDISEIGYSPSFVNHLCLKTVLSPLLTLSFLLLMCRYKDSQTSYAMVWNNTL